MKVINAFKNAFRSSPNLHSVNSIKEVDVREIVSRTATGNVSLQKGRYLTKEDIAEKRKNLCEYEFHKK